MPTMPKISNNKVMIFNNKERLMAVATSYYNAARLTGTGTQAVRSACRRKNSLNGYFFKDTDDDTHTTHDNS